MKVFRATALACGVFLAGCAASFPQPPQDSFGLANFAKVDDDVYRSGQPDKQQIAHLVEHYGIKSVIKLNTEREPANSPLVKAPHISGWSVLRKGPTDREIKEILDAIDCAPKPVLIHCLHGQDRTGLIVGLWRIRHGATIADAYTDMMRRGFHASYPGVWKAWLRATGWKNQETEPALAAGLASTAFCPSDALAAEPNVATETGGAIVTESASVAGGS
jgi:protein tyrosine phosphatase (PTP) superfamily phosphohydrolase (DUF442 family)